MNNSLNNIRQNLTPKTPKPEKKIININLSKICKKINFNDDKSKLNHQ